MKFPSNFIWGVATASFQIEGGSLPSERGLSVWDAFCETPGKVYDAHDGRIAADHYHRLEEDVKILSDLGVKAYRFSVSWPRILPDGTGQINSEGVDFYNRLIDALLEQGIKPYLTVFHWDLPYALHLRGGWMNPSVSDWMEEYAKVLVDSFSDRVTNWITLNEPQCFINEGYQSGQHAPGHTTSNRELAQAVHNALLAHGKIVRAIRQSSKKSPSITFTQSTPMSSIPFSEKDIDAARSRQFSLPDHFASSGVIYTDPIFSGNYPEEYLSRFESVLPRIGPSDMKTINQPIDFLGINLYSGDFVSQGSDGVPYVHPRLPGHAKSGNGWPVRPECMYWATRFCYERYGVPILITENGMSGNDWVHSDGKVHDLDRIDHMRRYLSYLKRALDEHVDIRGYFHWSLLDNFEWARGYFDRFGLVFVDFATGERTIKDSGYFYRDIIASHSLL